MIARSVGKLAQMGHRHDNDVLQYLLTMFMSYIDHFCMNTVSTAMVRESFVPAARRCSTAEEVKSSRLSESYVKNAKIRSRRET